MAERTLELRHTEGQLRGSLGELQEYTSRVETVNQLVELLQSCLTLDEAYQQAARVLQHFFPEGTLLMLNPSRNLLDAAARLGEVSAPPGPFSPESSWAYARAGYTWRGPAISSLLCGHVDPCFGGLSYRVPMAAQANRWGY